jgi:peptidoglycan/LPS O-acetylase OafA/YrhL
LGDASYAVYLFHWASFPLVKPAVAYFGGGHIGLLMTMHVMAALFAGTAIHLTIELPITRWTSSLFGLRNQKNKTQEPAPALATSG